MQDKSLTFADRISASAGGAYLRLCYACGTCVSRCMVQDRLEPTYNPRRLIKKAALDLETDVFADRTVWLCSACDLCFAGCPQQVHISDLLLAIRRLALARGHASAVRPAVVNPLTCVACGLCVAACPYEAIALQSAKVPGREKSIARVDPDACMACGLCGALCRSTSIGLAVEETNESIMEDLRHWLQTGEA
ncbi:MAG: 4Fe-4S dicluster domain-containing protein [Desulfobacteraceae bacterium]|jgi:heterodisulfide reductase subunit C